MIRTRIITIKKDLNIYIYVYIDSDRTVKPNPNPEVPKTFNPSP